MAGVDCFHGFTSFNTNFGTCLKGLVNLLDGCNQFLMSFHQSLYFVTAVNEVLLCFFLFLCLIYYEGHVAGFCALCAIQKHVSRALQSSGRSLVPKDLVSNLRCILLMLYVL
jgi:hypothetical protein